FKRAWDDKVHGKAFRELQDELKKACETILLQPKPMEPFRMQTDASDYAIGACLYQKDERKEWKPVAFFSKKLTGAQSRYPANEREILAIVESFKKWRHLILPSPDVEVYTDHNGLTALFDKLSYKCARMERWAMVLREFSFKAFYIKGDRNNIADYLSREGSVVCSEDFRPINQRKFGEMVSIFYAEQTFKKKREGKCFMGEGNRGAEPENLGEAISRIDPEGSWENEKELLEKHPEPDWDEERAAIDAELEKEKNAAQNDAEFQVLMQFEGLGTLLDLERIKKEQMDDPYLDVIRKFAESKDDSLLVDLTPSWKAVVSKNSFWLSKRGILVMGALARIVLPPSLREGAIEYFHTTGYHVGSPKTFEAMKCRVYWPNMMKDIKEFVNCCIPCQQNILRPGHEKRGNRMIWKASKRWESVHIDVVGPLPTTPEGYRYLLTIQDRYSKFAAAEPMHYADALTVATTLANAWIFRYATPERLISDRGNCFISAIMAVLHKIFGIKKVLTTAYHPQGNGSIERFHRTLKTHIRMAFSNTPFDVEEGARWQYVVPAIVSTYNASAHSALGRPGRDGVSPYEVIYGGKFPMPIDRALKRMEDAQRSKGCPNDYATFIERIKKIKAAMDVALLKHREKYDSIREKQMNKKRKHVAFQVGQIVKVLRKGKVGNEKKFRSTVYKGPMEVMSVYSPVTYMLKDLATGKVDKYHVGDMWIWFEKKPKKKK
ncbi:MAG: DDE-type integrase/transposase/recombinase, partial [bacterium]|nr:DDE-type integrase/transposase/recombinase [bacterium]